MARDDGTYHHGNLRRALLDAALSFIAERESLDFTMRELSRRAEVTHNAPYRHFADRDALLAALAEEGFNLLHAWSSVRAPGPDADPRDRVRSLGASYVGFAVAHPHHFRLMFGETTARAKAEHPELARAAEASFALLREAIEACRARGLLRRDVSARDLGLVAWSLVHGLAALLVSGQIPGGGGRVPVLARALATVFFEGALGLDQERPGRDAERGRRR
jgi:AcrR family transcriptional regulator